MNYPISHNVWSKGKKGFEVKDWCNNRICSDVSESNAQRIALCLNYCSELSNDELSKTLNKNINEKTLNSLGFCTDCGQIPEHHLDEPFSSCPCGTGEDYCTRPLQKLQRAEKALRATIGD